MKKSKINLKNFQSLTKDQMLKVKGGRVEGAGCSLAVCSTVGDTCGTGYCKCEKGGTANFCSDCTHPLC